MPCIAVLTTVNQCKTYFSLRGDFDANIVETPLGIKSYKKWNSKDKRMDGGEYGFSFICFGECLEYDAYAENQMRKSISKIKDKAELIKKIVKKFNANLTLSVVPKVLSDSVLPSLSIPLDVIEFCSGVVAKIDIDLYVY